jgi:tetratricopeptide (TPR) repeat protein
MIHRGLLTCFLLLAFIRLQSQDASQPSPQANKGIEAFKNKNFRLAISEFRDLLERYPKDPLYHYYLGASLVASNTDLSQGIELLKFVVSRNAVHEANYFLGLAYYRLYEFDKAIQYYQQFKDEASISQLKDFSINQEMQRIKMVQPYLKTVSIPVVVDKKPVEDTITLFKTIANSSGSFSFCPPIAKECIRMFDYKANDQNLFYYYSAISPYKIRGKEIYRIKKLPSGEWTEPENIGGTVNSMDDEDFPYFDVSSQNLYFATKGHQGYGGYDIYKSHYDSASMTWSKPENLGYPINTPFDDIIYLPDKVKGFTTFVSNRENEWGAFTIYYLVADDVFKTQDVSSPAQLVQESRLAVNADEKTRLKYAKGATEIKTTEVNVIDKKTNQQDKKTESTPLSGNYLSLISKGLHCQAECDSLRVMADALRSQVAVTPDDTERGKIQKDIIQFDIRIKEIQAKADKYYADAREIELEHRVNQKANLYQKSEEHVSTVKKDTVKTTIKSSNVVNTEYIFDVLPQSPYSEKNPIPIDVQYPKGVLYKIQLAAFSKTIAQNQFGGLKPITGEKMSDGVTIKYFAGWFKTYNDAESALKKVQDSGLKQAFIVSYYNGTKLPVTRAKEMEKE